MIAGSLEVQLYADVARIRADMEQAKSVVGGAMSVIERQVNAAKGALVGLTAGLSLGALVTGLASSVKHAIELADTMNKLSQRTGVAVEALSQLQFAAKLSNVSADDLTTGLKKLNLSIAEGMGGDKAKVEAFKNLGISLKDASGQAKSADKIMLEVADSFAKATDGATKTAYAVALFGKAGDQMIPMLNGGSAAIKDMMDKADRLGLTITKDFARKAEEFNDNLTMLKASSDRLAISLGNDLVSALGKAAKAAADAADGGKLHALAVGLNELGEQLFGWTSNAQKKGIDNLEADIKHLTATLNAPVFDLFGQMDKVRVELEKKTAELAKAKADYFNLNSKAGAGRGALADPRVLGDPGSIAQQTATMLKPLSKGTAEVASEYENLIKRINEKIAAEQLELKYGRELTEFEKFQTKILVDANATKQALTATEKTHIAELLKQAEALDLVNKARKAYIAEAVANMVTQEEINKALADEGKERDRVDLAISEQTRALKDSGDVLKAEASLLGATDEQRARGLGTMRIEMDLRRKLDELDKNYSFDEEQREVRRQQLRANAATEQAQLFDRTKLEEFQRAWGTVDQTAHDVFASIFDGGSNAFKKLGQVLKTSLIDLLYQMTVRQWVFQIFGNVTGAGGAAGVVGQGANYLGLGSNAYSAYNGGNSLVTVGRQVFGGSMSVANGAGTLYANATGSGIDGLFATNGAYGTAGSGSASELASAIGPFTAIAAVFVAAYQDGFFSGEKRSGGRFATDASGKTQLVSGPSGGASQPEATKGIVDATVAGINEAFSVLGFTDRLAGFQAAYETSTNGSGRGGVYAGGTLTSGKTFGESGVGNNYDWMNSPFEMVDSTAINRYMKTEAEATKEFALDLKQATLQALQSVAGIAPQTVKQMKQGTSTDYEGTGLTTVTETPEFVRVFDRVALAAADQLGLLPKKILALIKGVDFETQAETEVDRVMGLINTMIGNVKGFRQAVEAFPVEKLRDLGFDAAAALVEVSGGLEAFTNNLSTYYDNFYTAEEKRLTVAKRISEQLVKAGLNVSPDAVMAAANADDARAKFRALFESFEPGSAGSNALLAVAGAFAQITAAAKDTKSAADAAAEAVAAEAAAKAKQRDDAFGALTKALDGLKRSVEAERNRLAAEYQAKVTAINQQVALVNDNIGRLTQLSAAFRGALSRFRTDATLGIGQSDASAQLQAALAIAKAGGRIDLERLQDALTVVSQPSEQLYGSFEEYARNFDRQADTIRQLGELTDGQLSTDRRMLATLQEQLRVEQEANTNAQAALDQIVADAQAQSDALTGVASGLHSIAEALALFRNAASVVNTVTGGGGGGGAPQLSSSGIHDLFNGAIGLDGNPNATFDQIYQGAYANKDVLSLASLAAAYPNLDTAAVQAALAERGLPSFAVGTPYVPHDMLAQIHEGERIVTKQQNSSFAGDGAILAELQAVRQELANITGNTGDIAGSSERSKQVLEGIVSGDVVVSTEEVTA